MIFARRLSVANALPATRHYPPRGNGDMTGGCLCYKRGALCADCEAFVSGLDSPDEAFTDERDPRTRRMIGRMFVLAKRSRGEPGLRIHLHPPPPGRPRPAPAPPAEPDRAAARPAKRAAAGPAPRESPSGRAKRPCGGFREEGLGAMPNGSGGRARDDPAWARLVELVNSIDSAGRKLEATTVSAAKVFAELNWLASSPSAPRGRVRAAVRAMMMCTHPDKSKTSRTFDNFEKLAELWNRLR